MKCKIFGYEYKNLEVVLAPGETFYAERGSVVYAEEGIDRNIEVNSGKPGGGVGSILGSAIKSGLSGESVLIIRFTNATNGERKMVLAGSLCALQHIKLLNGETLLCRRGRYVASTSKVRLNIKLSAQGFLGGLAAFQRVEGEATVFLDSMGTPIEKRLGKGESIDVDEDHIVALHGFSPQQIQANWSMGNIFGGEGVSLMRVTGPGTIYLSPVTMKIRTY
jgi:uncharacterized protein (AIM24 family)